MKLTSKVTRKKEQLLTTWSGGTTTQLAIYPAQASYEERDFIWRVSSAKVESEESEFTSLPQYERIIMPLDGKLELWHEARGGVSLAPFDAHFFSGAWKTKSRGKVNDFNLIYREACGGQLEAVQIKQEMAVRIFDAEHAKTREKRTLLCYVFRGRVVFRLEGEAFNLEEGDCLEINSSGDDSRQELLLEGLERENVAICCRVDY